MTRHGLALLAICQLTACELDPGEPPEGIAWEQDAITSDNSLTKNSLTKNSLTKNSLTKNSLTKNSLTKNSLTKNSLVDGQLLALTDPSHPYQVLRTNSGARTLLTYMYECAMPPSSSMSLTFDGQPYVFVGELNLAPQWGQEGGVCNESCQRWMTACLLARTNPHGVSVAISLRAYHPSLAVTAAEQNAYTWNDGAFWGNMFAATPTMYACNANYAVGTSVGRGCATGAPGCPDELIDFGDCSPSNSCTHLNPNPPGGNPNPLPYKTCNDHMGTSFNEVITVYLAPPELNQTGQAACDGVDNDFDGPIDEGFHKGQTCDSTDADSCKNGTVTCGPGNVSICVESASSNKTETCNGLDDDCDGAVDNGLTSRSTYRDADGDGYGSGDAFPRCAAPAGWALAAGDCNDASGAVRPGRAEVCNGVDDDCDGLVDEGIAGVGVSCDGSDGDLCKEGVTSCTSSGTIVCGDSTGTTTEVCNGADDDCDGQVDEKVCTIFEPIGIDEAP